MRNSRGLGLVEILVGAAMGGLVLIAAQSLYNRSTVMTADQQTRTDLEALGKEFRQAANTPACALNLAGRVKASGFDGTTFGWLRPGDSNEIEAKSLKLYKADSTGKALDTSKVWIGPGAAYGRTLVRQVQLARDVSTTVGFSLYRLRITADTKNLGAAARPIYVEIPLQLQEDGTKPDTIGSCDFSPDLGDLYTATTCTGDMIYIDGQCKQRYIDKTFVGPAIWSPGDMPCPNSGTIKSCACTNSYFKIDANGTYFSALPVAAAANKKLSRVLPGYGDFNAADHSARRTYLELVDGVYKPVDVDQYSQAALPKRSAAGCNCNWSSDYPATWSDAGKPLVKDPSVGCDGVNVKSCVGHILLTCTYENTATTSVK